MKKILIVDADIEARAQLQTELQSAGYGVLTAGSAAEGMGLIAQDIHLAIVSVELPDQNGFVLCSRLKKQDETAELPIFITSSAETTTAFEQHSQLATHADGYFLKPLDTDTMLDELSGLFAEIEAYKQSIMSAYTPMPQFSPESETRKLSAPQDDEDGEILKALNLDNMNLFEDIDVDEVSSVQVNLDGYEDAPASLSPSAAVEAPKKSKMPLPKPSASFPAIPSPATPPPSSSFGLPAIGRPASAGVAVPKMPVPKLPQPGVGLPQTAAPDKDNKELQELSKANEAARQALEAANAEHQKQSQLNDSLSKENEALQQRLKEAETEIQNLLSQIEAFKDYDEKRSEKLTELAHAMIAIATGN